MRGTRLQTRVFECLLALLMAAGLGGVAGCRTPPPVLLQSDDPAPRVRFLLTFDDGPSIRTGYNPTLAILDQLADNDLQPGISGLFFVQPRHPRGGGTPRGREIMRLTHERGHVLGLHSVCPEGHVAHHTLEEGVLIERLHDGQDLLRSLTGATPLFVRPPFGARTARTREIYEALGLNLVLCDLRARDGIIYGFNASPRRRIHFRRSMAAIRERLADTPPDVEPHPVLISFHDLNPYTARHMTEYLHIIVDAAQQAGMRPAGEPFYSAPDEVNAVALRRRIPPPGTASDDE